MAVICADKNEVVQALPLIREALALCSGAKIECTPTRVVLSIDVDVKNLVARIELAKIKKAGIAAWEDGK